MWILPQLLLSTIFLLGVSYGFIKSFLGENGLSLEHYQESCIEGILSPLFSILLRLSLLSSFLSLAAGDSLFLLSFAMGEKWKRLEAFFRIAIMMPHSLVALFFLFFTLFQRLFGKAFLFLFMDFFPNRLSCFGI